MNTFFNQVHIPSWLMTGFLRIFSLIPLNSVEDVLNTNLITTAVNIYYALELSHLVFETIL